MVPSRPFVSLVLLQVWLKYVETPTTRSFWSRQDESLELRRARNTLKHDVFWTAQAQNTVGPLCWPYVDPSVACPYVGPIFPLCSPYLAPMLPQHVSKFTRTMSKDLQHDIFSVPGHPLKNTVGPLCWPYVDPSVAYPYVGPILPLCWPYLPPMLPLSCPYMLPQHVSKFTRTMSKDLQHDNFSVPGHPLKNTVGPLCWPYVDPSVAWPHVDPILPLCWPYLAPMLALSWP